MSPPDISGLGLSASFWPILALDHGLSGYADAVDVTSLPALIAACGGCFGAVVANYGLARHLKLGKSSPKLIVQCFGAPLKLPKVRVCDVVSAVGIGARGIAVQVDFSLPTDYLLKQIGDVASTVQDAHRAGLPALFMIAPIAGRGDTELLQSIRFCQELGADLIKVRGDLSQLKRIAAETRNRAEILNGAPLLLAGGPVNEAICDEITWAKAAGFKGYCVGRNIFNAANPTEISTGLLNAWYNS